MHFLVYGEDTFRSRRKLAQLRERFSTTRDASGMNVSVFEPDDFLAASEAIRTVPFLADKKLVIMQEMLQAPADDQRVMLEALASKPESTVVIFYEDIGTEALAKSPLFALLQKEKFSEEFAPLSPAAAEKFAADEAAAGGTRFDPKALRLFAALVGSDSWRIHEETAKLAAYAGANGATSITEVAVQAMVSDDREDSMFAFLDACVDGRAREASTMLERMLGSGISEQQLISMLLKQFRTAIAARDLLDRAAAPSPTLLGVHPYAASKAVAFARRHSLLALVRRYDQLIAMEQAFKSGGAKPKVTMTLFIAEQASARHT